MERDTARRCPRCGATVFAVDTECLACGAPLPSSAPTSSPPQAPRPSPSGGIAPERAIPELGDPAPRDPAVPPPLPFTPPPSAATWPPAPATAPHLDSAPAFEPPPPAPIGSAMGRATTPDGGLLDPLAPYVNTSGQGGPVLPEIERLGLNWGAFCLGWIWALSHRAWMAAALCWFAWPFGNVACGIMGNRWAWQNRPWLTIEHFKETQRAWARWGIIVAAVGLVLTVVVVLLFIFEFLHVLGPAMAPAMGEAGEVWRELEEPQ